jgi:hypothetical protein
MALLAEDIPEGDRVPGEGEIPDLQEVDALPDPRRLRPGLADPREVALDVERRCD